MKKFSDFNIKPAETNRMVGDKVKIMRLLNQTIVVHRFKVEESKFAANKNGLCLMMQVEFQGEMRVVFTGSQRLIELIKSVPEFPFQAVIAQEGESFLFA